MRTILCFGDSNTWGANPGAGARHPRHQRWPNVLAQQLGAAYEVIAEGQPGRTTVWPDPIEGVKCGKDYLIPCLQSHAPLDLVILLLGTNDLKHRFALTPTDIALGVQTLVEIIRTSASPAGSLAGRPAPRPGVSRFLGSPARRTGKVGAPARALPSRWPSAMAATFSTPIWSLPQAPSMAFTGTAKAT